MSCTHMLADQSSLIFLLNTWMDHHNGKSSSSPHPPSFDYHQNDNYFSNNIPLPQHPSSSSSKMVTIMLRFPTQPLQEHLHKIRQQTSCPDNINPFDLLVALFWTRITTLRRHTTAKNKHTLSICTDKRKTKMRQKKFPPIFFGNALHFSTLSMRNDQLVMDEIANTSKCIHLHVLNLHEGDSYSDYEVKRGDDDGVVGYGNSLTCMSMEENKGCVDFSVEEEEASLYSVMLGEKRPIHVGSHVGNVRGQGLVLVLPTGGEGGGRSVMVTLREEEIKGILDDESILGFGPTVLLAGGKI